MKFVCTECDEPMKFEQNNGMDEDGSLSVTFRCPSCEWGVTLLTNSQETQVVRTLGVKIGGKTVDAPPLEMLRTNLVIPSPAGTVQTTPGETTGSCPFSALVQDAFAGVPQGMRWSQEAEERLTRVPVFVRSMAQKGIEAFAREQGYTEITLQIMDEARERMGM
jgi:hypothetical protein